MSKDNEARDDEIHVIYSDDVDDEKRKKIGSVLDIFQGPLFAEMVRDTVAEFCIEGKLIYDAETDEFYELEDHLKLVAGKLLEEGVI